MKFNTLAHFPMTAQYRSWVHEARPAGSSTFYRRYGPAGEVRCNIVVSAVGSASLYADQKLQLFGVVHDIQDAGGESVMEDVWYSVQKIVPVFNAFGYISSYRHQIAVLAPELLNSPTSAPASYPDIDQQG